MADHNSYLAYKRDTRRLIYWMIHASNSIIKSTPAISIQEAAPTTLNTTGEIRISALVPTSKLIASHISPVPSTVYRLFQSVIAVRTATHSLFQRTVSKTLDPEIERSNATHKYFIDTLTEAFESLGGKLWASQEKSKAASPVEEDEDEASDDPVEDVPHEKPRAKNPKRRPVNKGKKGKRGKKAKGKPKSGADDSADEMPLESYHIIEDTSGLITDYLIAQTEAAIFVDFPGGHESYETVTNTITRGDPDNAQDTLHLRLYAIEEADVAGEEIPDTVVDIKEELMIYAYRDLLDFITDYQKTRSGKPTKSMLSQIRNWDPKYDLQNASKEQRITWPKDAMGQKLNLETIDWSSKGPYADYRTLFGLTDFAGEITSFAMQKPGTDVRQKIFPRHVFQVQCIVDSFTVCRGWSLDTYKGHVLSAPAQEFRSPRDVDRFLDREHKGFGYGYSMGVTALGDVFEKDAIKFDDPTRNRYAFHLLECLHDEFLSSLGESAFVNAKKTIPSSRFSNTNANGLWEYSPYLSGVGLVEALGLSYSFGFTMWEKIHEPTCVIHLYNMLVQKGYITQKTGLYAALIETFPMMFFVGGKAPTSDFFKAFTSACGKSTSDRTYSQRNAIRRNVLRTTGNYYDYLDVKANRMFNRSSFLRLYYDADWVPERIPDEDLPQGSMLGLLRMCQSKTLLEPAAGEAATGETPLISHAIAEGVSDQMLHIVSEKLEKRRIRAAGAPNTLIPPEIGRNDSSMTKYMQGGSGKRNWMPNNLDMLEILKVDIFNDVCGKRPFSAMNYIWATTQMTLQFGKIESELERVQNVSYLRAYGRSASMAPQKRVSLVALLFAEPDEECMEIMAKVFQEEPAQVEDHLYWDLHLHEPKLGTSDGDHKIDDGNDASCTVM
ncbi:hypothetical protein V494_01901 [Pseudogymnoascus sp. VKM F-4513 (FW-928)]|nr:hypothetical protein V494_01901 [Pseudogymnoascus sp. VKM F-4513 (FW-928)]